MQNTKKFVEKHGLLRLQLLGSVILTATFCLLILLVEFQWLTHSWTIAGVFIFLSSFAFWLCALTMHEISGNTMLLVFLQFVLLVVLITNIDRQQNTWYRVEVSDTGGKTHTGAVKLSINHWPRPDQMMVNHELSEVVDPKYRYSHLSLPKPPFVIYPIRKRVEEAVGDMFPGMTVRILY